MIERAKVTFYNVDACGYFKHGSKVPAFGSLPSSLLQLRDWSAGKHLIDTKTFQPDDGGDLHPAYLLDIREANRCWLVSTWNQTPANESGVASVLGDSSVGDAKVVINAIDKGSIPGFATYFWFIPEKNCFASVRFQHIWTGQKSLQRYVESFLELFSPHVVVNMANPDEHEVLGYTKVPNDKPIDGFISPRFRTSLVEKPGDMDLIRRQVDSIRRVVRKTTLQLNKQQDLAMWQRLLQWTQMKPQDARLDKVKVQYELTAGITLGELTDIITNWEAEHDREWDDYGFVLKGDANKTYWLSRSLARCEVDLNVDRRNDEVVDPASLLAALTEKRDELLSLLI